MYIILFLLLFFIYYFIIMKRLFLFGSILCTLCLPFVGFAQQDDFSVIPGGENSRSQAAVMVESVSSK